MWVGRRTPNDTEVAVIDYPPVLIPVLEAQPQGDGPSLYITRGLPACGKTTWALNMIDGLPGEIVRVNRDELRRGMLRTDYKQPNSREEAAITIAQKAAVEALLLKSRTVIVDDTNLRARYVREWLELARKTCSGAVVVDFTGVPLEVCIARDLKREGKAYVGAEVIRGMHTRYLASRKAGHPLPVPELSPLDVDAYAGVEPYVRPDGAPPAFLIDMDGTTALMGGRSPYDETRVGEDTPNVPVIVAARAFMDQGRVAIFMSGRTEGCRYDTTQWLKRWVIRDGDRYVLHMRKVGDQRPDHVVKLELFNNHVRHIYRVELAIDDRNQVVELWRRLGIRCWQVADGNF